MGLFRSFYGGRINFQGNNKKAADQVDRQPIVFMYSTIYFIVIFCFMVLSPFLNITKYTPDERPEASKATLYF